MRGLLPLLAVVLLVAACGGPKPGGSPTKAGVGSTSSLGPETSDLTAQSQAVLDGAVNADEPGCSAAVGVEGQVVWTGVRGVADLATGTPITTSTVFDIASVSKQFTATAILLLVGAGRLSLDDPLSDHVPGLPDWATTVTVEQLMHQTSGIPDYIGLLQDQGFDYSGHTTQADALKAARTRMLQSPTARGLVERFLEGNSRATIRFEEFPGSRIYETDGRKLFHAPRAFTEWRQDDGSILVRLNRDYLGTDEAFQTQDLPPTIAHELLGHGMWYERSGAENAYQAFHHHELNETNARLVGWLVDFELDGRFEENGAWSYLQDPAGFLSYLKLRLPYYALTFSNAELADPVGTLERRLEAARAKRAQLEQERANNRTWLPVLDHFVRSHGLAEARTRALRAHLEGTDQSYADELANVDALIAEVAGSLSRMKTEADHQSERYLKWAAQQPLFDALERETRERTERLLEMVRRNPPPADPELARKAEEHWRGQVTFDELVRMVEDDKRRNPAHWR